MWQRICIKKPTAILLLKLLGKGGKEGDRVKHRRTGAGGRHAGPEWLFEVKKPEWGKSQGRRSVLASFFGGKIEKKEGGVKRKRFRHGHLSWRGTRIASIGWEKEVLT